MDSSKVISAFQPEKHRHQQCLQTAINAAKKHCDKNGLRLTAIRQQVLELVWKSHEPVKAYDVLDELKQGHMAPPTVYRALDFLQEQGLVHKIESLNAYVGCGAPDSNHKGQFLICKVCGSAAEMNDMDIKNLISTKAESMGFKIDEETIEVKGVCVQCENSEQGKQEIK